MLSDWPSISTIRLQTQTLNRSAISVHFLYSKDTALSFKLAGFKSDFLVPDYTKMRSEGQEGSKREEEHRKKEGEKRKGAKIVYEA